MNVFGATSIASVGPRGPRGFPGKDSLELCYYLPNTISRSLRENEQDASFVLTSLKDCEMEGKKVKKWKTKTINSHYEDPHLVAVKPSTVSLIDYTSMYALNFPGQYTAENFLCDTQNPYGYLCITFHTSSNNLQTLIEHMQPKDHPKLRMYHEITITNSDISIHGYRDGKLAVEPIMHDTTKWTTFYLEWTAGLDIVHYTYTIGPHSHGTFQMDQPKAMQSTFTVGSRVDGSQPFSGQIHAIENYPSQHPVPDLIKSIVISHQSTKFTPPATQIDPILHSEIQPPVKRLKPTLNHIIHNV